MDPLGWSEIISDARALRDSLQELRNKVLRGTANSKFLESQIKAYYDFYEAVDNLRLVLRGHNQYKSYIETLDVTRKVILEATGPFELITDAVKKLEDLGTDASRSMLNQKRIKQRDILLGDKLPNLHGQLEALINVGDNSPAAPSTPASGIESQARIDPDNREGGEGVTAAR
jgi:hypothetical protein